MGRKKTRGQPGYIDCRVCEKAFKLLDPNLKILFYNINIDLTEDSQDSIEEYQLAHKNNFDKIKVEPFFKHLNSNRVCPGSRCTECDDKNKSYNPFITRHQKRSHQIHKHPAYDKVVGKTGYTTLIKQEVMLQTHNHIKEMQKIQKEYNLKFPNILVIFTDYQGDKKYDVQKQKYEEIKKQQKENKTIKKEKKREKNHLDINKNLNKQLLEQGLPVIDI